MNTHIIACSCICPVQDALYGTLNRVANQCTKKGNEGKVRCTVCGTLRDQPRT